MDGLIKIPYPPQTARSTLGCQTINIAGLIAQDALDFKSDRHSALLITIIGPNKQKDKRGKAIQYTYSGRPAEDAEDRKDDSYDHYESDSNPKRGEDWKGWFGRRDGNEKKKLYDPSAVSDSDEAGRGGDENQP